MVHEELCSLLVEPDTEWIDDVTMAVDNCVADVEEFLELWKEKSASESITQTWIDRHTPRFTGDVLDESSSVGSMKAAPEFETVPSIVTAMHGMTLSDMATQQETSSHHYIARSHDATRLKEPKICLGNTWPASAGVGVDSELNFNYSGRTTTVEPITSHYSNIYSYSSPAITGSSWNPSRSAPIFTSEPSYGDNISWGINHSQPRTTATAHQYPRPGLRTTNALPETVFSSRQRLDASNYVDSWIDDLDDNKVMQFQPVTSGGTPDISMAWMIQQTLPKVKIPQFDGDPCQWVEFITKFREVVHEQVYLNDFQRRSYLIQHLSGDPKKAVQGFANDRCGYVRSLKRL